jgi:formate hydrogenlyase subunit 3/multisubunit Na+/H+ antiporter MnhD subunit
MMIFFFSVLLVSSLLSLWSSLRERQLRIMGLLTAVLILGGTLFVLGPVLLTNTSGVQTSWWDINRFSALMGLLIAWLYVCAMVVSYHYLAVEEGKQILTLRKMRLYMLSVPRLVLSKLVATFYHNVGT